MLLNIIRNKNCCDKTLSTSLSAIVASSLLQQLDYTERFKVKVLNPFELLSEVVQTCGVCQKKNMAVYCLLFVFVGQNQEMS